MFHETIRDKDQFPMHVDDTNSFCERLQVFPSTLLRGTARLVIASLAVNSSCFRYSRGFYFYFYSSIFASFYSPSKRRFVLTQAEFSRDSAVISDIGRSTLPRRSEKSKLRFRVRAGKEGKEGEEGEDMALFRYLHRGGAARATPLCQQLALGSFNMSSWATCDPEAPYIGKVSNVVDGKWVEYASSREVIDPMNGATMAHVHEAAEKDLSGFVNCLNKCPKAGLHNPLKLPERYLMYGDVSLRVAESLKDPQIESFFTKLIMRVAPKSRAQALGEVQVTRKFFENFGGDNVRFLSKSFTAPGDYTGQRTEGLRWPFGPVALITPFNFPLEIPALQLMGALYMGNKPVLKVDSKVSIVMSEFLKLLNHCGMPLDDVLFVNCDGATMHSLLMKAKPQNTLFTGSQAVAELLAKDLNGKVKLEDAGFDWKIMGPDVPSSQEVNYIAWKADQDAYAFSGQKW